MRYLKSNIVKAKSILIAEFDVTEPEAHKMLLKEAMNKNRTKEQIATILVETRKQGGK